MRAAFAQTDITPDFPVELIGCYREDAHSKGVRDPLLAQILLLQEGDINYCLAAIDSLGLTVGLSLTLRTLLADLLHTDVSRVMLCFSHTHSAPAPLSPVNGERYFRLLKNRIEQCAADAYRTLSPSRASWAMTSTPIAENRRDGCNEVDRRLGILRIENKETDRPIVTLLRVSAHANILMDSNDRISSDYFGLARNQLQERYSHPFMLIQGASGNLKPSGVDKIHGGSESDLERIAGLLAASYERTQPGGDSEPASEHASEATSEPTFENGISMYSKPFLYESAVPSEEEANRIASEAKTLCGIDGSNWLNECASLRKSGISRQVQEGEIQFLFLGGACLCGMPDELFCEISMEASKRSHAPYLFLNGYTNGCTGYLPHATEWVKGGYETLYSYLTFYPYHGHVMPFLPDTAERIVSLVCAEWARQEGRRF
ncbi:MAG: hypothetical protein VB034_11315 [Eubacteriales bacterium]|nr:hypothetical protein [Eubacteriales bacterium]